MFKCKLFKALFLGFSNFDSYQNDYYFFLMQVWMVGARKIAGKEIAHLISVPAQLAISYKLSPVLVKQWINWSISILFWHTLCSCIYIYDVHVNQFVFIYIHNTHVFKKSCNTRINICECLGLVVVWNSRVRITMFQKLLPKIKVYKSLLHIWKLTKLLLRLI